MKPSFPAKASAYLLASLWLTGPAAAITADGCDMLDAERDAYTLAADLWKNMSVADADTLNAAKIALGRQHKSWSDSEDKWRKEYSAQKCNATANQFSPMCRQIARFFHSFAFIQNLITDSHAALATLTSPTPAGFAELRTKKMAEYTAKSAAAKARHQRECGEFEGLSATKWSGTGKAWAGELKLRMEFGPIGDDGRMGGTFEWTRGGTVVKCGFDDASDRDHLFEKWNKYVLHQNAACGALHLKRDPSNTFRLWAEVTTYKHMPLRTYDDLALDKLP